MDLPPLGEEQRRPPDAGAEWAAEWIAYIRQVKLDPIPIALHLDDGSTLPGELDSVKEGKIVLDDGRFEVPGDRITAFTLAELDRWDPPTDEIGRT
jgi:hypothetical protein